MKDEKAPFSDLGNLSKKDLIKRAKKFSKQFCITDGKEFRLKDFDPSEDAGLGPEDKPFAKEALQLGVNALSTLQEILYAQDKWGILLIFQAMDAPLELTARYSPLSVPT